ncbi:MAG TPA: ArsC family transcriptional regulator [Clostridiales bacterium]|jgi:arsenate reductase|nr:ArsC family transcriptional regulator [Clostridiales bacterium]
MNIQIFGKSKCFDTKKAERYFKERRIKYQFVDIIKYGMSAGEFKSVLAAVGFDALFDDKAKGAESVRYLAHRADMEQKLFENQNLIRTPVVRNGKKVTVGYCPEVWKDWE